MVRVVRIASLLLLCSTSPLIAHQDDNMDLDHVSFRVSGLFENQLMNILDEARTTKKPVIYDGRWGRLKGFDRNVKTIVGLPDGKFDLIGKNDKSIGIFTIDELMRDYD